MSQAQQIPVDARSQFQDQTARPWFDLEAMNQEMNPLHAEQRVAWTLEHFPGRVVLTSQFRRASGGLPAHGHPPATRHSGGVGGHRLPVPGKPIASSTSWPNGWR
jgi:hypothetical protein